MVEETTSVEAEEAEQPFMFKVEILLLLLMQLVSVLVVLVEIMVVVITMNLVIKAQEVILVVITPPHTYSQDLAVEEVVIEVVALKQKRLE